MSNPIIIDGTSGVIEMTDAQLKTSAEDAGVKGGAEVSATAPSSPAEGDVWLDSSSDSYFIYLSGEWKPLVPVTASSGLVLDPSSDGTVTSFNGEDYIVFNTSGNLIVTEGADVPVILVGGGGSGGGTGGGWACGGGGAGGVLTDDALTIAPGTYPIVIGAGSAGGNDYQGDDTTAFGLTALGGGRGGGGCGSHWAGTGIGGESHPGCWWAHPGGSGGGPGNDRATGDDASLFAPGTGTPGQGFDGGPVVGLGSDGANGWAGGGGGATEAGGTDGPGDGGDGLTWHNGVTYAGGGAGQNNAQGSGVPGEGGGAMASGNNRAGAANTGGGGGGGGWGYSDSASVAGGSGIVVIKVQPL